MALAAALVWLAVSCNVTETAEPVDLDAGGPPIPREPAEAPDCPVSLSSCDGDCVDLRSDPLHCGACGEACAADAQCVSGSCLEARSCPSGLELCSEEGIEQCVDVRTSDFHCGACGRLCGPGQGCAGGACR